MAKALARLGQKISYWDVRNLMVHADKKRLRQEFAIVDRIHRRKDLAGVIFDALPAGHWARLRLTNDELGDILETFPSGSGKSPDLP